MSGNTVLDKVHTLPLLNATAHEWTSLTTALVQLHNLSKLENDHTAPSPVLVWLDMDVYKRVRKMPYLDPKFSDMTIESPMSISYGIVCTTVPWNYFRVYRS